MKESLSLVGFYIRSTKETELLSISRKVLSANWHIDSRTGLDESCVLSNIVFINSFSSEFKTKFPATVKRSLLHLQILGYLYLFCGLNQSEKTLTKIFVEESNLSVNP